MKVHVKTKMVALVVPFDSFLASRGYLKLFDTLVMFLKNLLKKLILKQQKHEKLPSNQTVNIYFLKNGNHLMHQSNKCKEISRESCVHCSLYMYFLFQNLVVFILYGTIIVFVCLFV